MTFAFVMVDTGIGAGVVFDGEVRRFPSAAEFGLMVGRRVTRTALAAGVIWSPCPRGRGIAATAKNQQLELGTASLWHRSCRRR